MESTAGTPSPTLAAGVSKSFGPVRALKDINLQINPGITGLLGPNGAGKTTLLRLWATVIEPDTGNLCIVGRNPRDGSRRLIRRCLGYMPQDATFYERFTVHSFLDYVARLKEIDDRRRRREEVERVIETVDIAQSARRRLKGLSGGTRRRVALAQALLGSPPLLLLDEPTAGLDPEQRYRFRDTLSELAEHASIVISTHQTEDVTAICRQVAVIDQGSVRFVGSPEQLREVANGRVWLSTERAPSAVVSWRTSEGKYRNIGQLPLGANFVDPVLEDGYLTLVGSAER